MPPMCLNSHKCFVSAVLEDEVKANTDYMTTKRKAPGCQYLAVDFLWSFLNHPCNACNEAQFNLTAKARTVKFPFSLLDLHGRYLLRDLSQKKNLGIFKKELSELIPAHVTALVKLTAIN